jgi:imidazole glycerol phosphate synthase subunit HisF
MVLSIEAKQQSPGSWEVYTDCGRERSGVDAVEWARRGVELGAGEILVTSIDREGTMQGYDLALTRAVCDAVGVPVIAVPTSVGYGASFGGIAALLGMLNSCAAGVTVVNIDNGFGAAAAATRINHGEVS